MTSCVYFLQVDPHGPIKIGCTKGTMAVRIKALQQTSPHILKWIGWYFGERSDELAAHKRLANSKLRSEWFHPTREVLGFIAEKSPNFSEQKYIADVFMEPERSLVKRAVPRYKASTVGPLHQILEESGYSVYEISKWLSGNHLPDPVRARKAAACAARILGEVAA